MSQHSSQASSTDWRGQVSSDTSPVSHIGYIVLLATLGVFLAWAAFVPISSAVVAPGKIVSSGQNKQLQHPRGGIVLNVAAKDGDRLTKGDLVVRIDPSADRAELSKLQARRQLLMAQKGRLEAEAAGIESMLEGALEKSAGLAAGDVQLAGYAEAIPGQQQTQFQAKARRMANELAAFQFQHKSLTSERDGALRRMKNQASKVKTLDEQIKQIKPLAKQGYVAKTELWDRESAVLDARSEVDQSRAQADGLTSRISEVEQRIGQLKATNTEENAKEHSDILAELAAIGDQITAAQQALTYTDIRAPSDGVLAKFAATTIGGVVRPGEVFGEIVPSNADVVIEARVSPADISDVRSGLKARLTMANANQQFADPIAALVTYVAADSSFDEPTQQSYFVVRLKLADKDGVAGQIHQGMAGDVMIEAGSQPFLDYLMRPMLRNFRRAFNER